MNAQTILTESRYSTCLSVSGPCCGQPPRPTFADSGRLTSSRPFGAARRLAIDQHSAVIRKQLDWVVEAAHRIFADAFEIEFAFDEVGERSGQQHRSPQLFGEGFETRSHVDRRADDGEVEPGA